MLRTLKEQAIHGGVFEPIDDVRKALGDFANTYNEEWLINNTGAYRHAPLGSTSTSSARHNAVACPEIRARRNARGS